MVTRKERKNGVALLLIGIALFFINPTLGIVVALIGILMLKI